MLLIISKGAQNLKGTDAKRCAKIKGALIGRLLQRSLIAYSAHKIEEFSRHHPTEHSKEDHFFVVTMDYLSFFSTLPLPSWSLLNLKLPLILPVETFVTKVAVNNRR